MNPTRIMAYFLELHQTQFYVTPSNFSPLSAYSLSDNMFCLRGWYGYHLDLVVLQFVPSFANDRVNPLNKVTTTFLYSDAGTMYGAYILPLAVLSHCTPLK
jgi:hypothetical protein